MIIIGSLGAFLIKEFMTNKNFRKVLFTVLGAILAFFLLIIISIACLPSIIINGVFGEEESDYKHFTYYQDAIFEIDLRQKEWIEKKKNERNYDDLVVNYNYTLSWHELIAIDSVRYEQDFTNLTNENVIDLGEMFIIRNSNIETYYVTETYIVTEIIDEVECQITKSKEVEKTRLIIDIDTKEYSDVLESVGIIEENDIEVVDNIYETMLDMEIEGELNIYDSVVDLSNLKKYPEGSANLPYYNQTDIRWGASSYGYSNIASGGCGPTSLAMVVAGLTNNEVTPLEVSNWSVENGHRAEGFGSYWSLMIDGGAYYGLQVETVSRRSPNKITEALSQGHPVIVAMGKGRFTRSGHFIVLRGLTSDGKILVHDSASVKRSSQTWSVSTIINQSSIKGGVNGSPFWIFKN